MRAKCRDFRALLAIPSVNWSDDERNEVEAHLVTCADCAALARIYTEQDRLLRCVPGACLTPAQRSQLLSRIKRKKGRIEMQIKLTRILGAAATVVVIIAIGLGARVLLRNGSPVTDSPPTLWPTITAEPTEAATTPSMPTDTLEPTTLPTITSRPTQPPTTVPTPTSIPTPSPLYFETVLNSRIHLSDLASDINSDINIDENPALIRIETHEELGHWFNNIVFIADYNPSIYFERDTVLVLVAGTRTLGGSVEIESLEDANGEIIVRAVIHSGRGCPTPQVNSMPYHMIKTARIDKPLSLSLSEIPYDCETGIPTLRAMPTPSCEEDGILGEYLVVFKEDAFPGGVSGAGETAWQAAERLMNEFNGELHYRYPMVLGFVVLLPPEAVPELEQRPEVDSISLRSCWYD